jgi:hypothetical protein
MPTRLPLASLAALIVAAGLTACAGRGARLGIPTCPRGPVANYLADAVLQCWFDAPNGRWRTLSHEFHYDSLVFDVEADSLEDARTIAERIVGVHGKRFMELALYVRAAPPADGGPRRVRRVRWSSRDGYEPPLDFEP